MNKSFSAIRSALVNVNLTHQLFNLIIPISTNTLLSVKVDDI